MSEKFYLTTPIYYVNARPHIGHAYTTIVADVLARRARAQGPPVGEDGFPPTWFLTGTDEHGQKIERSAAAANIPPQQFADEISAQFRTLWDRMGLTYNQFIRTTDPAHKRGVQKLFTTLQQNGHIYLSSYTGAYCVSDETFVDVPTGTPCPDCGRPTETVTEENYFFRLSNFQLPLLNLIESNQLQIEPESRRNEVLSFLRGGLKDLSISRSSFTWGIPVPGDPATAQDHVIYVWLDALANYMTAVGYGDDSPEAQARFAKYWPADLHIVGKEIIRFHCVYWPAFLLALNPATNPGAPCLDSETWDLQHKSWIERWLPKKIVAHGWLLFDDAKMSKSKGNIVRTETILEAFGTLCPPPPAPQSTPNLLSSSPSNLLSSRSEAEGSAVASLPAPPQPHVILSEAASQSHRDAAQSKNPEGLDPATTVRPFPTETSDPPQPTPHDRDLFAADVLRYFLLREIPFGQDGSFSFEALITRYNADLANGYGNLVSRTLSMIQKYFDGMVPHPNPSAIAGAYIRVIDEAGTSSQPTGPAYDSAFLHVAAPLTEEFAKIEHTDFTRQLQFISQYIGAVDGLITSNAPWKLASRDDEHSQHLLRTVLYASTEMIRIITALLHPILPYATANVWRQLGLGDIEQAATNGDLKNLTWGGLQPGTRLGPLSPIFPRADKGLAQIMANMESLPPITTQQDATTLQSEFAEAPVASVSSVKSVLSLSPDPTDPAAPPRTSTLPEPNPGTHVAASAALTTERPIIHPHNDAVFRTPAKQPADASPQITIDDFAKIELRVAQILVAERIPKADKLLRLEVDLGYERRQILSGIAEWYTPEDLLGRRIVVITNLAPRTMRGLESHGMLLAASTDGGKPHLATIDSPDLPLGSRLK